MKRDWDLIRAILLEIEALERGHYFTPRPTAGHSPDSVQHHLHLLEQAGLVECTDHHPWNGEPVRIASTLTLLGHDVLDSIRDKSAWHATPPSLLGCLGVFSYDVLRQSA